MSHKSGHIIINRVAQSDSPDVVQSVSVELKFPEGTSDYAKIKKVLQVERLLDKLDQDDDDFELDLEERLKRLEGTDD